jgi:putative membrane protein
MFPVRFVADPTATAGLLVAIAAGICLGTASGLVPGLHANTLALVLAGIVGSVPGPPRVVGAAMLAAGVTHTFLDIVPTLALGVPDPAMAAGALPSHRLVLEGRGREALRLSAIGSAGAVICAVPLAIPVTLVMVRLYPLINTYLSVVLGGIGALLIITEPSWQQRVGALLSLAASGGLGLAVLDKPVSGLAPVTDILVPVFSGLFGAPILLAAITGTGVPPQADPAVAMSRRSIALLATIGTLCGGIVGYLPGVSSAIAATLALGLTSKRGPRAFVVTTSGVNTATAVFALFALVALGEPRTGVLVALRQANIPVVLPALVSAVVIAAVISAILVPYLGDRYLRTVGQLDPAWLSIGVLAGLIGLSAVFAGPFGIVTFSLATLLGHIPPQFGCRRATLMGILLVPLLL